MTEELVAASIGATAAIAGALITGIFDWFRQIISRPRLKLDYLDEKGNRTEAIYPDKDFEIHELFVRVRLRNVGRRPAKGCRLFLIGLQEVKDGNVRSTSFYDSMELSWASYPEDFNPRDIPNGVENYANIASVTKNKSGWVFHIRQIFSSHKDLMNYKGTYRFKLLATADNADPEFLDVDVSYDQSWQSLRANTSPK